MQEAIAQMYPSLAISKQDELQFLDLSANLNGLSATVHPLYR